MPVGGERDVLRVEEAMTTLADIAARKLAPEITGFDHDMLLDEQQAAIRDQAQRVIDASHAEEMREALGLLCEAKDLKETCGDCDAYREVKERGWAKARAILSRLDNPTGQP
jgi:hypothetical protein